MCAAKNTIAIATRKVASATKMLNKHFNTIIAKILIVHKEFLEKILQKLPKNVKCIKILITKSTSINVPKVLNILILNVHDLQKVH